MISIFICISFLYLYKGANLFHVDYQNRRVSFVSVIWINNNRQQFQDLPNNMIHQVTIKTLPQEWLWCETWCDDSSKKYAKTIDLVRIFHLRCESERVTVLSLGTFCIYWVK